VLSISFPFCYLIIILTSLLFCATLSCDFQPPSRPYRSNSLYLIISLLHSFPSSMVISPTLYCLELTPLFAAVTKIAGVYPDSSHFGTALCEPQCALRLSVILFPPSSTDHGTRVNHLHTLLHYSISHLFSFQSLPHSFALTQNLTLFLSIISALFAQNTRGWVSYPFDGKHEIANNSPSRLGR